MLRTPRQSQEERTRNAAISYANGALFAPAKPGSSFAANREGLVIASALGNLDAKAKESQDARLEASKGLRL